MNASGNHAREVIEGLDYFSVRQNTLFIDDTAISGLSGITTSTPFYAYSRQQIIQQVKNLRSAFGEKVNLTYAIKSNPMPSVVHLLADHLDGFDIASHKELLLAINSGAHAGSISFAGPGKTDKEISCAISSGIMLSVESAGELSRIETIRKALGKEANIIIRINPDFDMKRSGITMGGGAKPFGIDSECIEKIIEKCNDSHQHISGFHIYHGSQTLDSMSIVRSQNYSIDLVCSIVSKANLSISTLNLGGGFGIPYFSGDKNLDLHPIANNLIQRSETLKSVLGIDYITIELGRYISGPAGVYIARIIDIKKSRGKTFYVIDGGMNHHLAASGNLGQIMRKNFPVVAIDNVDSSDCETVTVVGPLCSPLDIIAEDIFLPTLQIGDLIGVLQSGAYGLSASPTNFLSHPLPEEILF